MNYYQAKKNLKSLEKRDHYYYDALITKRQQKQNHRYNKAHAVGQEAYQKGKLMTDCPYKEAIYVVGWCDGYFSLYQ